MSGARAAKTGEKDFEKGRVEQTKVQRYWPGRAPEWEDHAGEDDVAATAPRERTRTEISAPVIVKKAVNDPRLLRLARVEGSRDQDGDLEDSGLARRRHAREDESEEEESEEDEGKGSEEESEDEGKEEEEDEEEALKRRQAVRERMFRQQQAEEEKAQAQEEEEEEEEGSSEYETDSEDEDDAPGFGRRLLKPVFVPKEARETIAERDALEKKEEQLEVKEKARLVERKIETQQLVRERVAQEEAEKLGGDPEANRLVESVDTDDEADAVVSYENWKQRELRRIRRDREEQEAIAKEAEDKEKLRNMTDIERAAWERANPKDNQGGSKKKLKFLQKYYHKGAYYQEAPDDARGTAGGYEIYKQDYSGPTGEDLVDKSTLPAVMQVKKFGRSGQTKWTHLVNEDTTVQDDPMIATLKDAQRKRERMAGGAEEFAKPRKFKHGTL